MTGLYLKVFILSCRYYWRERLFSKVVINSLLLCGVFFGVLAGSVYAAPGDIHTVAGGVGDGNAHTVSLNEPQGMAVDTAGNIYIAEDWSYVVRKIDAFGAITTVAGNGYNGYERDGVSAISTSIEMPKDIAFDAAGNLYIATGNRIRKVDTSGIITTVAGNGEAGYSGDGGPAINAKMYNPRGVYVDAYGNIYISDSLNNRIRKVDVTGIISTIAGTGMMGYSGDNGPAISATLYGPEGIFGDSGGNIFFADTWNNRIRKIDLSGVITTRASGLSGPRDVIADALGNLYISDCSNQRVRKLSVSGVWSVVAGTGTAGYSGDGGLAVSAALSYPYGITADHAGNIYIADSGNYRIRKVDSSGVITTVAGNGFKSYSGDGGQALSARLYHPYGVFVHSSGNMYIADSYNNAIRKVDPSGIITTFAGTGVWGYSGDGGPATAAAFKVPSSIVSDDAGDLYIMDMANFVVRKIDNSGTITTLASVNGTQLALDRIGDMYVANQGNHVITKVDAAGNQSIVAGVVYSMINPSDGLFSGDGGPATEAKLNHPKGVAVDKYGNLFIADTMNNRIRKVDKTSGIITTVAGNGMQGYSGDGGPATSAKLYEPEGIVVDSVGNIFFADRINGRVRMVDTAGTITTVAGGGSSDDGGPAISARLNQPTNVYLDASRNIYIADNFNHRIRKVEAIPDTKPDPFTFDDQRGVPLSSVVISNAVMVHGISDPTLISISGGEYSINGGGFTAIAGKVNDDDTVIVRQTSPSRYSTASDAVLIIGGVSGIFRITTIADTTPEPFTFTAQTATPLNTVITSNSINVTDISESVAITIMGGEYEINNNGAWISTAGIVNNGDSVRVRQTSSASYLTKTEATLTIGGVGSIFSVTTDCPATGITLSVTPEGPSVAGTPVVFSASTRGSGHNYVYQYWLKTGAKWSMVQDYSLSDSWSWDTTGLDKGRYTIQVRVKIAGSPVSYDVLKSMEYGIK